MRRQRRAAFSSRQSTRGSIPSAKNPLCEHVGLARTRTVGERAPVGVVGHAHGQHVVVQPEVLVAVIHHVAQLAYQILRVLPDHALARRLLRQRAARGTHLALLGVVLTPAAANLVGALHSAHLHHVLQHAVEPRVHVRRRLL